MPAAFTSRVAVGTTATTIATEQSRLSLLVRNMGPGMLYVGGSTVSTGTGYPLPPDASIVLGGAQFVSGGEATTALYGISDSGTTVAVLEVR